MFSTFILAIPVISSITSLVYCIIGSNSGKSCLRGIANDLNDATKELCVIPCHKFIKAKYVKPKSDYENDYISITIDKDDDLTKESEVDFTIKKYVKDVSAKRTINRVATDALMIQAYNNAVANGDAELPPLPGFREVYEDEEFGEEIVENKEVDILTMASPVHDLACHLRTKSLGSRKLDSVVLRAEADAYLKKHFSRFNVYQNNFTEIVAQALVEYKRFHPTDALFDEYALRFDNNTN